MKKLLLALVMMTSAAHAIQCSGSGYQVSIPNDRTIEVSGNGLNVVVGNASARHDFEDRYFGTVSSGSRDVNYVEVIVDGGSSKLKLNGKYGAKTVPVSCR